MKDVTGNIELLRELKYDKRVNVDSEGRSVDAAAGVWLRNLRRMRKFGFCQIGAGVRFSSFRRFNLYLA